MSNTISFFMDVLLPMLKDKNIWNINLNYIPLAIKTMIVLTILGRDSFFDNIPEVNNIIIEEDSDSIIQSIVEQFIDYFVFYYYWENVHLLKSNELNQSIDSYTEYGMPGTIGNIDCFDIVWDQNPNGSNNVSFSS